MESSDPAISGLLTVKPSRVALHCNKITIVSTANRSDPLFSTSNSDTNLNQRSCNGDRVIPSASTNLSQRKLPFIH